MDPVEKIKSIAKRAQQRYRERQAQIPKTEGQKGIGEAVEVNKISDKVVKLPVETEEHRATPNICLRSVLFGVVKRGRRARLEEVVIASQDGYRVTYSGERLDQADLDVWLAVKHFCASYPLGTEIEFSAPEVFGLLGKSDGQANRETLKRSLKRMHASVVGMLAPSGAGFEGHMIDWWKWDEHAYRFRVILSPKMAPLFRDEEYTLLAIRQRQQLARDLSRWLHGYWSSHDQIYPIYDITLMKLCGAEVKEIWKFRQLLRTALKELDAMGFVETGWNVDRHGLVKATKAPTVKALQRALRKKRKAA